MDHLKVKMYENTNQIRQHSTQIKGIDSKVRANNKVVEGLPEPTKKEENDKSLFLEMVRKPIPNFQESWITTLIRLGQVRKNKKKPKSLLVCLNDPNVREQILREGSDIKENSGNQYLRINRDQNDNARRRHSLVKACYKLLLKNKYAASMKGLTITYYKKQYGYAPC